MWFDNIGHKLNVGDYVLCLTGTFAYSVQRIKKLSQRDEGLFIRYTVSLECKATVSAYNVISLNAINLEQSEIVSDKAVQHGFDVFGNKLNIGDEVLFLHKMEVYTEVGMVTKLAPKTCIFDIRQNRFGQSSYKKPYGEIISLSALNLNENIIQRENRECEIL